MENRDIEARLTEIAELLDLKGENQFKVRAYENAARAVASLEEDVAAIVAEKRLRTIRGIGDSIAEKITQMVETGACQYLDELREGVPEGLIRMLEVPGLGPKKVKALWERLGITSIDALQQACDEDRIAGLKGFGKRTQDNIKKGLAQLARTAGRRLRSEALPTARELLERLRALPGVVAIEIAGSLRRGRETVKDVDIVAGTTETEAVMQAVREWPRAREVIASGATKTSILTDDDLQIDVRAVAPGSFACALAYFTGSKEFNVAMRGLALDLGFSLNEYSLNPLDGSPPPPLESEEDLFRALGLAWVPPELRENTGEMLAAREGKLPRLLEPGDLQGVLHVHTTWSDGTASLEAMVAEAERLGYRYIGISEHSAAASYANGLDRTRLLAQRQELAEVRARHPGILVLHGIEADILEDGSLDLDEETLGELDFVIASVHSGLKQSREAMTARIVRALSNPVVRVLGHPQGRKFPSRDVAELDWEQVLDAAEAHGVAIEVNGHPRRLDADWVHIRRIRHRGVKLCVNPDAHSVDAMDDARAWGVTEARRGWATAADVINTLPAERFVTEFLRAPSARRLLEERGGITATAVAPPPVAPPPVAAAHVSGPISKPVGPVRRKPARGEGAKKRPKA